MLVLKMKQLDLLRILGFPFELFFPVDPTCEEQEKLLNEGKIKTSDDQREYGKHLTKHQRRANERLYNACSSYNSIQSTEAERLTASDFYKKLKTRWEEGQETAQISKLDEYEALDSRWRKWKRRQDGEESESDDDSDLEEYF